MAVEPNWVDRIILYLIPLFFLNYLVSVPIEATGRGKLCHSSANYYHKVFMWGAETAIYVDRAFLITRLSIFHSSFK